MIVCNCTDLEYNELLELVKQHGDDLEKIMDESDAGTVCESCMEEDCDITDIPLKEAIAKAMSELNN